MRGGVGSSFLGLVLDPDPVRDPMLLLYGPLYVVVQQIYLTTIYGIPVSDPQCLYVVVSNTWNPTIYSGMNTPRILTVHWPKIRRSIY